MIESEINYGVIVPKKRGIIRKIVEIIGWATVCAVVVGTIWFLMVLAWGATVK